MVTAKYRDRTGCRKHKNDGCHDIRLEVLRDVLDLVEYRISQYGITVVQESQWGYPCNNLSKKDFTRLNSYRDTIQRYYEAKVGKYNPCLSASEVSLVMEKAKRIGAGIECETEIESLQVDRSNLDFGDICIPYENWEKAMAIKMPKITPKVDLKKCLRFTYDVVIQSSKEQACELIYDISVEQKDICDLTYEVKVDKDKCEWEYDVITEKHDCEIDYETYVHLRECGISYDLITKAVECNLNVKYDKENKEIYFETTQGNIYNVKELHSLDKIKI